jgi:DNA-binding LytR/AlgR family response regulator
MATSTGHITLRTLREGNIVVHAPSEVVYLEAAQDMTNIMLAKGCQRLVSGRLGVWVKRLEGLCFLRVHRSYAINISMVEKWRHEKDYLVVQMRGGQEIIVAESYKSEFWRYVK